MELTFPPAGKNPGWRRWWAPPRWERPRLALALAQSLGPRSSTPTPCRSTGLDIGTAKPCRSERARCPTTSSTWRPPESFDAARFCGKGGRPGRSAAAGGASAGGGRHRPLSQGAPRGHLAEGEPAPGSGAVRQELASLGLPSCMPASSTWTRPPPPGSTPTTPYRSSGPWR